MIVSDAGARATYGRLLPEDARAKIGFLPKLDAIGASMAHSVCNLLSVISTAQREKEHRRRAAAEAAA